MTRRPIMLMAFVVAASAMVACGNVDDGSRGDRAAVVRAPPSPSPRRDDAARAREALIRRPDMPKSWREQSGNVARLHCGTFDPFAGASAVVRSLRLTGGHAGVQERIALYRSAAAAAHALRGLDSARSVNCLRRELRRHVTAESGSPASPATLVREEPLGPTAHAKRYTSWSVGNFGRVVGFIDVVHARVGRALAALVVVSDSIPLDERLYDQIVALVRRRLHSAVG